MGLTFEQWQALSQFHAGDRVEFTEHYRQMFPRAPQYGTVIATPRVENKSTPTVCVRADGRKTEMYLHMQFLVKRHRRESRPRRQRRQTSSERR